MTKKLVGLMATVALLGSGMALAQQDQSQTGSDVYGGSGTTQQGQMGGQHEQMKGQMGSQMMGEKEITGTVVKSSSDELKLRTDSGIIAVKINKDTKFQDPNVKRARDIKEGQQVRTGFDIKKDENIAKSISLETGTGGGGMMPDTGINQPSDQGLNQGKDVGDSSKKGDKSF